jgi:chlorite dismutase
MTVARTVVLAVVALIGFGFSFGWAPTASAADREKLLSEPGVYGTFAAFRIDDEWGRLDQQTRQAHLGAFKGVVERHRDKLAIDTYLLRGLSDYADILLRVHGTELKDSQQFLLDVMATPFGAYLTGATILNGMSKKANYVPGFSDQMKADLKAPSESGPYVAVIPIRKDADWWALPQDQRFAMMREHTEAALPYHKTVKRKLYHSTGLDDFDFITYFETARPEDLHSLILALSKVKEARHNKRFGHPTLLGTIKTVDQLVEALGR